MQVIVGAVESHSLENAAARDPASGQRDVMRMNPTESRRWPMRINTEVG